MARIRCHYADCVFLDEGYCSAAAVEIDHVDPLSLEAFGLGRDFKCRRFSDTLYSIG